MTVVFLIMTPLISLIQLIWTEGPGENGRSRKWLADLAAMDLNNEIDGEKSEVVGCTTQRVFVAGDHTEQ